MIGFKDGGPAFPDKNAELGYLETGEPATRGHLGMSIRDYFAAAAMTGILAQWAILARHDGWTLKKEPLIELDEEILAERCYKHADAMLAARSK